MPSRGLKSGAGPSISFRVKLYFSSNMNWPGRVASLQFENDSQFQLKSLAEGD